MTTPPPKNLRALVLEALRVDCRGCELLGENSRSPDLAALFEAIAAQDEEIAALRRERDHYQREARAVLVGADV